RVPRAPAADRYVLTHDQPRDWPPSSDTGPHASALPGRAGRRRRRAPPGLIAKRCSARTRNGHVASRQASEVGRYCKLSRLVVEWGAFAGVELVGVGRGVGRLVVEDPALVVHGGVVVFEEVLADERLRVQVVDVDR